MLSLLDRGYFLLLAHVKSLLEACWTYADLSVDAGAAAAAGGAGGGLIEEVAKAPVIRTREPWLDVAVFRF